MPGARATPALPLALSMGDPAGIGLDITLLAWLARAKNHLPPFAIISDHGALDARARALGLNVPLRLVDEFSSVADVFDAALPVIAQPLAQAAQPGRPHSANAAAIISSIERAASAVATGKAAAIVTNPIAKSVLYEAGFTHPGHTEFLGELARRHWPKHETAAPVMMIAAPQLRVVPTTIHVPLRDVPALITRDVILHTVRTTAAALHTDFGIAAPRIAVTGLNPHAGEGGAMGREDDDVIAPAIAELQRDGLAVTGPHSADTLFHTAARATYDAVVAMYHDQALIPVKTLAFDEGVNVTLGLPFVRTSPDHGTAFAIAGHGTANPSSLIAAIKLAHDMGTQRTQGAAA